MAPDLVILALCIAAVASYQVIPATDPLVQRMGRTYLGAHGGLEHEWLGGGFRVQHTGKTLWATLQNTSAFYKISFTQANEGFFPPQGISWVTPASLQSPVIIASGAGVVRVTLNVPPQYWAPPGTAGVLSFTTDGEFVQPPPLSRVLHFIGDSITAATNVNGGVVKCGDGGYEADYMASWAGILCSIFDANCSTIAVGGRGLVRNCCGGPPFMPEYYTWLKYSSRSPLDFAALEPPAGIVLYLGTNDYSAGGSPALDAEFTAGLLTFMHNATRVWYGSPSAPANITFFFTLGPMSPTLPAKAMTDAIAQGTSQGYKIALLNVTTACGPSLTGCTDGCAGHPGILGHRNMADMAHPIIAAALGWA